MTGETHAAPYRPDIDGLRAIAVVAVVLFHAKLPFVDGGFVGVDVFFVISGFLITTILLRDRSVIGFYQRRARRILPALLVLVATVLAAATAVSLPHDLIATATSAEATLLFGSNLWFWRQAGYFATETELWPLLHTWSLGVEEQFYIVFPLLLRLFGRLTRRWTAVLFIACAVVSLGAAAFAIGHVKPVLAFYMAPLRAWELLAGSVLATGALPAPRGRVIPTAAAAAGLILVLGSAGFTDAASFPGFGAIPPVLGSALVIWAGLGRGHALTGALGSAPLRFIGLISYSLYLWHWPVLAFARYVAVRPLGAGETALAVLLAVVLATLSWRFVEQPFRRGMSNRAIWLVSAGGSALLLAWAAALVAAHGLPWRYPPAVVALNAEEGEDWRCPVTTFVPFGNFYACPIGLPSRRIDDAQVVLWGDSHAQMYAPALRAALRGRGALLVNANGCAPVATADAADPVCGAVQRANFARIAALPARTVIIAQNWPQYRDEAGVRLGRAPTPAERYGDATRRLRTLVAALRQAGKRVVIVGPLALPGYDLASDAARDLAFRGRVRTRTGMPRDAYLREYANVFAAMDELSRDPEVRVLRPDRFACVGDACPFIRDGRAVFADRGHLTETSARRMTPLFAQALR